MQFSWVYIYFLLWPQKNQMGMFLFSRIFKRYTRKIRKTQKMYWPFVFTVHHLTNFKLLSTTTVPWISLDFSWWYSRKLMVKHSPFEFSDYKTSSYIESRKTTKVSKTAYKYFFYISYLKLFFVATVACF